MRRSSTNNESDSDLEFSEVDDNARAERLLNRGRATTARGVTLVADRYGLRSIPVLIKSLVADSPKTREQAFESLRSLGEPAFHHLLLAATAERGELQIAVIRNLGRWRDPRAVQAIVRVLESDYATQRLHKAGKVTLYTVAGAALLALLTVLVIATGGLCDCSACGGACCGGETGGSCFACEEADSIRLRKQAIGSLASIGSLTAVGAIARMTRDKNASIARSAYATLLDMLQRIHTVAEGDASALGTDGVSRLVELLPKQSDQMVGAILVGLARVGDSNVIPAIERVTANARRTKPVRLEACDTLTAIRERIARENLRDTLVRPANENTLSPPEQLLRPLVKAVIEPPSELLRANENVSDQ